LKSSSSTYPFYKISEEREKVKEFIYPNDYFFDQSEDKGWINVKGRDILQADATLIQKDIFLKLSNTNKVFLNVITNGVVNFE